MQNNHTDVASLSEEIREQLKNVSGIQTLSAAEKMYEDKMLNDGKWKWYGRFAVGVGLSILYVILDTGVLCKSSYSGWGGLFTFFSWLLIIGMVFISFIVLLVWGAINCMNNSTLKSYREVYVLKGYVQKISMEGRRLAYIIYYDFEKGEFRTRVCGEDFLRKHRILEGEVVDLLAVEKKQGVQPLCLRTDVRKIMVRESLSEGTIYGIMAAVTAGAFLIEACFRISPLVTVPVVAIVISQYIKNKN